MKLQRWLPCLDWAATYDRVTAGKDGLAAVIVTLMLIPQSLAYAMLAGLPPITGLYASIAPLFLYAIFGSSRTLAVGPVAVISLMTAAALGPLFAAESAAYIGAAMLLAALSGLILLLMALLRLGFLANFLSHPVISGFISASGLLIALSQFKHILGVKADGQTVSQLLPSLAEQIPYVNFPTLLIGGLSLLFLQLSRTHLKGWLLQLGCTPVWADSLTKMGPVVTIIVSVVVVRCYCFCGVPVVRTLLWLGSYRVVSTFAISSVLTWCKVSRWCLCALMKACTFPMPAIWKKALRD